MAQNVEAGAGGIRWGRALIGGLMIEVGLILLVIPFYATMADPFPTIELLVPPVTLVLAALAGAWAARPSGNPLMTGLATGAAALLIYGAMMVAGYLAAPEQFNSAAALSVSYLASHVLKLVGGLLGGNRIRRQRAGQWVAFSPR